MVDSLDVKGLLEQLPQRYPFLLVDRVLSLDERHVRALKNVSINEQFFAGHFPGEPLMPAVLILEGMAQTAGLLCRQENPQRLGYLVGVDGARFRRRVVPGDQLIYEGTLVRRRRTLYRVHVEATVDGEPAAEALISIVVDGQNAERP